MPTRISIRARKIYLNPASINPVCEVEHCSMNMIIIPPSFETEFVAIWIKPMMMIRRGHQLLKILENSIRSIVEG